MPDLKFKIKAAQTGQPLFSMKLNLKFLSICLLGAILLLFSQSCRKNKRPLYSTDDIAGQWRRVNSSKPEYDSLMYVSISGSNGTIDSTFVSGYFTVGTIKWKSITPDDDSIFVYQELGSDNSYYTSKMTYIKKSNNGIETLFLQINSNGDENGSWQYWERQ
jgi:hypothetical protein